MLSRPRARGLAALAGLVLGPALSWIASGCATTPASDLEVPPPPETRTEPVDEVLHSITVTDPYRWLEDQQAPASRAWIEAQNTYTDSLLGQVPGRDEVRALASRLVKIDAVGVPVEAGGRYFFQRRDADQDLGVLYFRDGPHGADQVLVDPHPMSEDHSVNVSLLGVSGDGRIAAYSVRHGGVDEIEVHLRAVDTGRDLPDVLPLGTYADVSMCADGQGLYYSLYGAEGPQVRYHAIGTDVAGDPLIFGENCQPFHLAFGQPTEDGRWLVVHVLEGTSGPIEIYLKDLMADGPFVPVVKDGRSRSTADLAGDRLLITTDRDAPNRRVMIADANQPGVENWRELVPHREDAVIESASAVGGRAFVSYLHEVQPRVAVYELDGTLVRHLDVPTLGTVALGSGHWDRDEFFYTFSSFHAPPVIYRGDARTGQRQVWAEVDVPIDTGNVEVRQEWYTSKDGTRVPMFLAHRKDLVRDGDTPTLMVGYGGFGMSLTPGFSPDAALWIESGGLFVMLNLRGGGEFGEAWHEAGMLGNKQNVFDDCIAAAESLIDTGYTRPERLAVMGGSNGGILVGAMLTQRPDLFGAIVCTYPLLDMIRYHECMVARYWVPELGSAEDPEQFRYLLEYSPYHRVREGESYPATLFITGDGDTRVDPMHARKMAARVQAANASANPILLRYHIVAGHSGGQTTDQQIEEMVDLHSFLDWRIGAGEGGP